MSKRSEEKVPPADFHDVKVAICLSLLAWPLLYMFNNGFEQVNQDARTLVMMVTGFCLMLGILFTVAKISRLKSLFGYVFILFTFTAMIDLIIWIEYHGYISGFMSQYLKLGEPYLHSPWGSVISLFDGIGFYFMYLILIHQISNGKSWRSVGIYWGSALINSMVVLLFGIVSGRHTPTFCAYLNAPYAIVPMIALIRLFDQKEPRGTWREEGKNCGFLGIGLDCLISLGFLQSIWITFVKGMLSIGSTVGMFLQFLKNEPVLLHDDPAPFAKIQNLIFLFYVIPLQLVSLFYIFRRKKPQILWEFGLIHAGIMLQAQFTFIVHALDPQLKKEMRSEIYNAQFWYHNLIVLIIPHVYLLMLYKRHIVQKDSKKK